MIEYVYLAPQQLMPTEALILTQDFFDYPGAHQQPDAIRQQLAIELTLQSRSPGLDKRLQSLSHPVSFYFDTQDLSLNPVSKDPEIAACSKARYLDAIQWALQCNARYLLLPSLELPIYRINGQYRNWFGKMVEFWESVLAVIPEHSRLTCVLLNYQDATPDTLSTLVQRIGHPKLKAGLDVGMVKLFSQLSPLDWLESLGDLAVYVRMTNNNGQTMEALPVMQDEVDFPALANHLALLNRKLSVSFVGSTLSDTRYSLDWLHPYLTLQERQYAAKRFLV